MPSCFSWSLAFAGPTSVVAVAEGFVGRSGSLKWMFDVAITMSASTSAITTMVVVASIDSPSVSLFTPSMSAAFGGS
jgi:hypothetical protein